MLRDPHTTAVRIGNEIGLSKAAVQRAIEGLKAGGIVSRRGSNNGGRWVIAQMHQSAVPTEDS
ncbi:MAG: MarR family transcriptional regulator [Clostridia bacterium]|nr:MarR family transcriptional regulator [Clostridia bacterium]